MAERKALCVGIDYYQNANCLAGCVNDANDVKNSIERNYDGLLNFSIELLTATSPESEITVKNLKQQLKNLAKGTDLDTILFYFSGHGFSIEGKTFICTSEFKDEHDGLSLEEVTDIISKSKANNKIIILDSCFSGAIGDFDYNDSFSIIKKGVTILAACNADETASEVNKHGVFTSLLVDALNGGAANILGQVTPASVYSYIDSSLGPWGQRPLFKANISRFICLKNCKPSIYFNEIRRITDIFNTKDDIFKLDPTYEPDKSNSDNKEVNKKHEEIFKLLQKYNRNGLVVPKDEEYMYFAAIHSTSCYLTAIGKHYRDLVDKKII